MIVKINKIKKGLRNGGGIGESLISMTFATKDRYFFRFFFDILFFALINIIFLNIIFGIIIDTFAGKKKL